MKVSFLVTFYNQEQYVNECLDSILKIYKPCEWEILIGDDGSTDGTVEAVKKYIEKYPNNIELFISERNEFENDFVKRASLNRLNLLSRSTGDFFCTVDGDDYYCDINFLVKAIDIFNKRKDISIIMFGYKYFYGNNNEKNEIKLLSKTGDIRTEEYIEKMYVHAGACVHRNAMSKNEIDRINKIGYFDDNDIVMNSLNYGNIFFIDDVVYAYRQDNNSIYNSKNKLEKALLNVQGHCVDTLILKNSYIKHLENRNSYSILYLYLNRKKIKENVRRKQYEIYVDYAKVYTNTIIGNIINYDLLSTNIKKQLFKNIINIIIRNKKIIFRIVFNDVFDN